MEVATVSKIKFRNILQKCNNKIDDWRIYIWKISIKCVAIRGGGGRTSFIISVIMTWYKLLDGHWTRRHGKLSKNRFTILGLPGYFDQTKEHILNNLGLTGMDVLRFVRQKSFVFDEFVNESLTRYMYDPSVLVAVKSEH